MILGIDTVFIDIDGVLADFVGAVGKHFNKVITNDMITHWDALVDDVLQLTVEEFWEEIDYQDFWLNMNPTPYAAEIMRITEKYDRCLLTSPSYRNAGARQAWIKKHFPKLFYEGKYIITSSKHYLADQARVLIDDYDKNIDSWIDFGGFGIVFPRPWNSGRKDYLRPVMEVKKGLDFIEHLPESMYDFH